MPKECPDCEQVYPDFVDFCVADGRRLVRASPDEDDSGVSFDAPVGDETSEIPLGDGVMPGRARLFPKVRGDLQPYGVEFFGDVVLGRFDPDVGAVDVDLNDMPGQQYIAARHVALTFDDGNWYVEDLGSENGTFVERGPRISERTLIENGQELALGNALFVFETDEVEHDE